MTVIVLPPADPPAIQGGSSSSPSISVEPPPSPSLLVLPVSGPPGAPGPAGGENFTYTQIVPAAVWTITHNLGRRPTAVSLFNADYSIEYGEFMVQHLSTNQLRISMETPVSGVALIG